MEPFLANVALYHSAALRLPTIAIDIELLCFNDRWSLVLPLPEPSWEQCYTSIHKALLQVIPHFVLSICDVAGVLSKAKGGSEC